MQILSHMILLCTMFVLFCAYMILDYIIRREDKSNISLVFNIFILIFLFMEKMLNAPLVNSMITISFGILLIQIYSCLLDKYKRLDDSALAVLEIILFLIVCFALGTEFFCS